VECLWVVECYRAQVNDWLLGSIQAVGSPGSTTTDLFFGDSIKLELMSTRAAQASIAPGFLCNCFGQALAKWPV